MDDTRTMALLMMHHAGYEDAIVVPEITADNFELKHGLDFLPWSKVKSFDLPITMDDNRTMAQLLEAPTEGYEDAIVVPEINANNFEIKHGINLVQNKAIFWTRIKEDPHVTIR
ncbi:hypothetical protein Tco_1345860 [Tanacetum coccineum]